MKADDDFSTERGTIKVNVGSFGNYWKVCSYDIYYSASQHSFACSLYDIVYWSDVVSFFFRLEIEE